LSGNKNLKDLSNDLDVSVKDTHLSTSYTKTNKLIMALYMVTDIMDKEEPIRTKLRTLGVEILSDTISLSRFNLDKKVQEVLFLIDIVSAMNFISEMNCNILRKEFLALNASIKESFNKVGSLNRQINLSEFFQTSSPAKGRIKEGSDPLAFQALPLSRGRGNSKGHHGHTRIGVQKGSTLMKALSDKTHLLSNSNQASFSTDNINNVEPGSRNYFNMLKKQRRNDIVSIVKIIGNSATIKDIKDKVQTTSDQSNSLIFCSEKTLQRELMSMTKDGVLYKTGEKRWSRYSIKLGASF